MEQPNGLAVEDYNSPSPIVLGGIALVCLVLPLAVLYLVWGKRRPHHQHKGAGLVRSASTDTPTSNRTESSGGLQNAQRRRLREDGRVQHSEEIDLRSTNHHLLFTIFIVFVRRGKFVGFCSD
jgi:hypothetical protein